MPFPLHHPTPHPPAEVEREKECVCIVSHQAVLRALYGYFMNVDLEVGPCTGGAGGVEWWWWWCVGGEGAPRGGEGEGRQAAARLANGPAGAVHARSRSRCLGGMRRRAMRCLRALQAASLATPGGQPAQQRVCTYSRPTHCPSACRPAEGAEHRHPAAHRHGADAARRRHHGGDALHRGCGQGHRRCSSAGGGGG